ncbi:hypothetical protein [Paenibacillus sp.]|uniref:hypothetical protein n=1 Tax=Paenibacillus sp. TaxID=58172 RepID=UPI0028B23990|nr:hypothetical protein [Paenibacillus sp.]
MQLRLIKPTELDQAALLADSIFREAGAISMKELFPLIFRPGLSHSYAAIAEDGTVAAFMGLVPSTIKTGNDYLDVFSIGAVCSCARLMLRKLAHR